MALLTLGPNLPVHKTDPVFYARTSPIGERILREPKGYPCGVWVFGNVQLLNNEERLGCIKASLEDDYMTAPSVHNQIEKDTEEMILQGFTLVTGYQTYAMKRAAVVPLRWGTPRILVLHSGIYTALGENLDQEPFRAARLWRYKFDPCTDLAISYSKPYSKGATSPHYPARTMVKLIRSICAKGHCR